MIYVWPVVIFITFLAVCYGLNRLWKRGEAEYQRVMLKDRLYQADAQLPRAGLFDVAWQDPTFTGAADPGQRIMPLAGGVGQHIREIEWLQEQAEQAIPERWR